MSNNITKWPTALFITARFRTTRGESTDGAWRRIYQTDAYENWETGLIATPANGTFVEVAEYKRDNRIKKNISYYLKRAREEALAPIRNLLDGTNATNITDDLLDQLKELAQ